MEKLEPGADVSPRVIEKINELVDAVNDSEYEGFKGFSVRVAEALKDVGKESEAP